MTRTKLKICGITTLADARYCAGAGVDYLGFIQYPESPRYIDPVEAHGIIEWLYGPEAVGVFVNETAAHVNEIADLAGFTHVQYHGDQPPSFFDDIDKPVIKAFSIYPDASTEELLQSCEQYAPHVDAFIMDTGKAGVWGGTGETFDWQVIQPLMREFRVFVAGGLHAGNIQEVIQTLHPYAVDLSSGVEQEPGIKDFDKLAALFDAIETN